MFRMNKWMIRWGQILFILNIFMFFLTGHLFSLVVATVIALVLWMDTKFPVLDKENE